MLSRLAGERDAAACVAEALAAAQREAGPEGGAGAEGGEEAPPSPSPSPALDRWVAYGAAVGRARAAGKAALRASASAAGGGQARAGRLRAHFGRLARSLRGPPGGEAAVAVARRYLHALGSPGVGRGEYALPAADADGDGVLSPQELVARYDLDGDGVITAAEHEQAMRAAVDDALRQVAPTAAEADWAALGGALRLGREFRSMLAQRVARSGVPTAAELPRDEVRTFLRRYLAECSLGDADGAALTDNAFVALPPRSARLLALEPNLYGAPATGAAASEAPGGGEEGAIADVWLGRMWQLRALLAARKVARRRRDEGQREKPKEEEQQQQAQDASTLSFPPGAEASARLIQRRWRGARERARAGLGELEALSEANPRGLVLLALGARGLAGGALRAARAAANAGYVVVAPEAMASKRGERPRAAGVPSLDVEGATCSASPYWDEAAAYPAGTPLANPLADAGAFAERLDARARVGVAELAFMLRRMPRWARLSGVILMGFGEGAMLCAQLDDSHLGEVLLGKVLVGWPCAVGPRCPARERAALVGSREHPVLAVIGAEDEFFGGSHAGEALAAHAPLAALSVVIEGHGHDVTATPAADAFFRELLLAFLLRPHRIAALRDIWAREPHLLACLHTEERLARAGSGGAQVQVIRAVPEEADRVRAAEAAKLLL